MPQHVLTRLCFLGCILISLSLNTSCNVIPGTAPSASESVPQDSSLNAVSLDSLAAVAEDSLQARQLEQSQSAASDDAPSPDSTSLLMDSLLSEVASLKSLLIDTQEELSRDSLQTVQDSTRAAAAIAQNVRILWVRVILTIVVLVLMYFVIAALVWTLEKLSERSAARRLFFKKLVPISRIVLWCFAIYVIVVNIFQVTGAGLLSAGTAVGVALGFAAQDILKNIFGGLIIIMDQPFQVGDKINVGGTYGEVISIGLRSTRIVTPDDNLVSVPNAQVVESQVANANAGNLDCQVVIDLYLPGWIDVTRAKAIAYSAAANSKYVYLDKPIAVLIKDEFKETFLTHLVVKAYVFDCLQESAFASEITETAKTEFLREGFLTPMMPEKAVFDHNNNKGGM